MNKMYDVLTCDRDFTQFLATRTQPAASVTPSTAALVARTYDQVTAQLLHTIHTPAPEIITPAKGPTGKPPTVKLTKPLIFTRAQFQIALKVMEKQTKGNV